ncbi:MAG: DUF447 domain-containing protein, partial [Gammaproteobacteria bacterium]
IVIREVIVTTRCHNNDAHIAPMGVHERGEDLVIAPFKPSTTLENLLRENCATVNYTDDVRVFAGCLTGRRDWPVRTTDVIDGLRLSDCLAHAELRVKAHEDDALRPRFICEVVHETQHAPFHGFNRAQAAVVEAAILVSRLQMLPQDKIEREIEYLTSAVDKTAGAREREAWEWLIRTIAEHSDREQRQSG